MDRKKTNVRDVRVVKEGTGRSLGIPSGGQAVAARFLKFPLYSISLQSPSHPPVSLAVSLLICLLRDRQVMEKKLKGKIQGNVNEKKLL